MNAWDRLAAWYRAHPKSLDCMDGVHPACDGCACDCHEDGAA